MSDNSSMHPERSLICLHGRMGYVNANGLKIHYYRTGGDKPKVIFNHGAGDDGLCWTRVVKELEADYDCIMVDGRGHGLTSSGKGDYSTAQRVADLAGLIQALGLERPVVGGHSLGADTSMNFAALHPELTRAVFLEDPPIIIPGEKFGDGTQEFQNRGPWQNDGEIYAHVQDHAKIYCNPAWPEKCLQPIRMMRSFPG